jgi:hypothetical protein
MYICNRRVDHDQGLGLTPQIAGAKSPNDPDDLLNCAHQHMCLLALALSPMQPESILTPSGAITKLLTNTYL